MEQYIPKSALVAEIERIKSILGNPFCLNETAKASWVARKEICEDLLSFIDSTEVKEVDLEKLINDYFTGWYFDNELDILAKPNNYSATVDDVKEIARHFFKLGLKAKQQ